MSKRLPGIAGATAALPLHACGPEVCMTTAAARRLVICAMGMACVVGVGAQAPDNTARNRRDRQTNAKTADQQSNTKTDVDVTRRIRRAIVADKALSTNAHNVKIITRGGKVTLKGPVRNQDEK